MIVIKPLQVTSHQLTQTDWDLIFPAKPNFDILYALEWSALFKNDRLTREWHHFPNISDRKQRIGMLLEACNTNRQELGDVVSEVANMKRTVASHEKAPSRTWHATAG